MSKASNLNDAAFPMEAPSNRFYRSVWRWHFYAGLFVIPFMLMLATTGMIYLFKPQLDNLQIHGMDEEELQATLKRLQREREISQFSEEVSREKEILLDYLHSEQIREAFEYVDRLPPDLRVVLKPYVTQMSGARTLAATANATVDLVRSLLDGREIVVSGQVRVDGEFYDIHTSIGVPIIVTPMGWTQVVPIELWEDEALLLKQTSDRIKSKIQEWSKNG